MKKITYTQEDEKKALEELKKLVLNIDSNKNIFPKTLKYIKEKEENDNIQSISTKTK